MQPAQRAAQSNAPLINSARLVSRDMFNATPKFQSLTFSYAGFDFKQICCCSLGGEGEGGEGNSRGVKKIIFRTTKLKEHFENFWSLT